MITAQDLLKALLEKHPEEKWVRVPECKTGSSWMMRTCRRLDLWVMSKSWSPLKFIGYEIKASRQDFLKDEKWGEYLPYCKEFYFVAPPGIIDPGEVPDGAGLLLSSKNARRLYCKKKAPVRDVQVPTALFAYILMWRSKVLDNEDNGNRLAYWRGVLKALDQDKRLGHEIARKISARVKSQVGQVLAENNQLRVENDSLQEAKRILEDLGIDVGRTWQMRRVIQEKVTGVSPQLLSHLAKAEQTLRQIRNELEER